MILAPFGSWAKSSLTVRLLNTCFVIAFAFAFAFAFATEFAHAGKPQQPLKPFTASYKFSIDTGIKLSGKATRKLTSLSDNNWLLSMTAQTFFAHIKESSQFFLQGNHIRPVHYQYQRQILGQKHEYEIIFDADQHKAKNTPNDTALDIAPTYILDKLSMQVQLQQDIAWVYLSQASAASAQYQPIHYTLATDGTNATTYTFQVQGKETLNTPLGDIETIKLTRTDVGRGKRSVSIWLAPQLDYNLVRIYQQEANGDTMEFNLLHIDTEGA